MEIDMKEILPTRLYNALGRLGYKTLQEVIEDFDTFPKYFESAYIRNVGIDSYLMLEYLIKVELP